MTVSLYINDSQVKMRERFTSSHENYKLPNPLSYATLLLYTSTYLSPNAQAGFHMNAEFTALMIKITPTFFLKDDNGLAMFQEYF